MDNQMKSYYDSSQSYLGPPLVNLLKVIMKGIKKKMKKEMLKLEVMLETESVELNRETIVEMLDALGNLVEDVEHYPTLPDTIEELAYILDIVDISEASEDIVLILEELVLDNQHCQEERERWFTMQQEYAENFN